LGAGEGNEPIMDRVDDHRDRKCRETEDKDFKIKEETRHQNPDQDKYQCMIYTPFINMLSIQQK